VGHAWERAGAGGVLDCNQKKPTVFGKPIPLPTLWPPRPRGEVRRGFLSPEGAPQRWCVQEHHRVQAKRTRSSPDLSDSAAGGGGLSLQQQLLVSNGFTSYQEPLTEAIAQSHPNPLEGRQALSSTHFVSTHNCVATRATAPERSG
jgi:hypothetical protein